MTQAIEPFILAIPETSLADLKSRLRQTRWPDRETVSDWSQGAPLSKVQALCAYWADDYDWRRCEATLNGFGQFRTRIDDLGIHFIHVRSPHPGALPLILTHGWPGSVIEMLKVIGPLTDPTRFGGKTADAFDVVVPSLPGYGFSDKPTTAGVGVGRIAQMWVTLMRRLGYSRFVAQGGDWGAAVTTALAMSKPPECVAVHLNMALIFPNEQEFVDPTDKERAAVDSIEFYRKHDSGYAKQQGTRPQTLGYGLNDSPAGQAAWIYEKFHAWTDNDGEPESALTQDEMIDNIMLYWLPGNATSSARLYWESAAVFREKKIDIPVGVSIFPKEIFRPSRRWAERAYSDIVHWNELERGGHFAAFEQPQLFVNEVRNCFQQFR